MAIEDSGIDDFGAVASEGAHDAVVKLMTLAKSLHAENKAKGFWPDNVLDRNFGEAIALIHSELCEAQESFPIRTRDDKVPQYSAVYVEIADAAIRTLDLIGAFNVALFEEDFEDYIYDVPGHTSLYEDISTAHVYFARVLEAHRKGDMMGEEPAWHYHIEYALSMLFAICYKHEIPLLEIVEAKAAFNRSRPFKHGKSY